MVSPQSIPIQLPLFALDKRCKKCGMLKALDEFHHGRARCKECVRQSARAYYQATIAVRQAKAQAYYWAHREQQRASADAWKAANQDKVRAYNREHAAERAADVRKSYRKNPERKRAYSRRYRALNKAALAERQRARYALNPEPVRMYVKRREARLRACEGTHTLEEWNALKDFYGQHCLWCGATDRPLTADHIVPITKGGTDYIDNIQPLCHSCNSKKHDKIADYRTRWARSP